MQDYEGKNVQKYVHLVRLPYILSWLECKSADNDLYLYMYPNEFIIENVKIEIHSR